NEITFVSGVTTPHPITIRVYDDAEAEDMESFTLKYNISGTTNAIAAPSSLQSVISITNNKKAPVSSLAATSFIIGARTYYLGDNAAGQPFDSKLKSKRNQMLYKATELKDAGITSGAINNIAFDIEK